MISVYLLNDRFDHARPPVHATSGCVSVTVLTWLTADSRVRGFEVFKTVLGGSILDLSPRLLQRPPTQAQDVNFLGGLCCNYLGGCHPL